MKIEIRKKLDTTASYRSQKTEVIGKICEKVCVPLRNLLVIFIFSPADDGAVRSLAPAGQIQSLLASYQYHKTRLEVAIGNLTQSERERDS